jgi:hypothetical protein
MTPYCYRSGAARAAGLTPGAFGQWLLRHGDAVLSDDDLEGQEPGAWRRYSVATVTQLAIAGTLWRSGFPVALGLRVGMAFVLRRGPEEVDLRAGGAVPLCDDLAARVPPAPFREGSTWAFVRRDGAFRFARVLDDASPNLAAVETAFEDGLPDGAFVMKVNPIYESAARTCGADAGAYRAAAFVAA